MRRATLPVLLTTLLLAACGRGTGEPPTPERLFNEAKAAAEGGGLFGSRDCIKAEEKVEELRQRYPYHALTLEGELILADCALGQGRSMEAVGRWEAFRRLHPAHHRGPQVLLKIAQAQFDEYDDYDRDLATVYAAVNASEELLREYPAADEAPRALEIRRAAREILAKRELYVARFYRRQGDLQSAADRYEIVLAAYGDLPQAAAAKQELRGVVERLNLPRHRARPVPPEDALEVP